MSILDRLSALLAPYECLGCAHEGKLLCSSCQTQLQRLPERCYRCSRLSANGRTCTSCRGSSRLHRVKAVAIYEGLAKDIVWKLKSAGIQIAATEMAHQMAALVDADQRLIIMHAPTATSRIRQRGYDQAELLAKCLAYQLRLPFVNGLVRINQSHQVGSNRMQRLTQLQEAFRVRSTRLVQGADILLVDDVLTTGATLEAAAASLRAAGARRVSAIVFAQA